MPRPFCSAPNHNAEKAIAKNNVRTRTYLVGEDGFEPSKSKTTDLQSAPFGRSGTLPYLHWQQHVPLPAALNVELVDGFEPPTC